MAAVYIYVMYFTLFVVMIVVLGYCLYSGVKMNKEFSEVVKSYHAYVDSFKVKGTLKVEKDNEDKKDLEVSNTNNNN